MTPGSTAISAATAAGSSTARRVTRWSASVNWSVAYSRVTPRGARPANLRASSSVSRDHMEWPTRGPGRGKVRPSRRYSATTCSS